MTRNLAFVLAAFVIGCGSGSTTVSTSSTPPNGGGSDGGVATPMPGAGGGGMPGAGGGGAGGTGGGSGGSGGIGGGGGSGGGGGGVGAACSPAGATTMLTSGQGTLRQLIATADTLYWSTEDSSPSDVRYDVASLRSMSKAGGTVSTLATIDHAQPWFVAADMNGVYWEYQTEDAPYHGVLTSISKSGATGDLAMPVALGGVALDDTSVYWIEQRHSDANGQYPARLMKRARSGGASIVLRIVPLDISDAFAVDDRFVYFMEDDTSYDSELYALDKDGGTPTVLIARTHDAANALIATHMAVDATRVYWSAIDYGSGAGIFSAPKTPGDSTLLARSDNEPTGLALDGDDVYYSGVTYTADPSLPPASHVATVPKNGGTLTTIAITRTPRGVAADASAIYWSDEGSIYRHCRP